MRIAAGILMMIIGALLLVCFIVVLIQHSSDFYDPVFDISFMICGAFLVTGGVFCLKKKYWGLCLASALLTIFIMTMWSTGSYSSLTWLAWVGSILGILPIIFVCLTKKEWKEIQG
jgi:hypothetical protein